MFPGFSCNCKDSPIIINTLTRDRREATLWSKQRWSTNPMNWWKSHAWVWPHRPRRIQAPTKNPPHSKDGVFCFIRGFWWFEFSAETDVAVKCFFSCDNPVWSQNFVLHSLHTQPTKPTTLVPLTQPWDICRGAFLCETTWVTFHTLNLYLTNRFPSLRFWPWNCHWLQDDDWIYHPTPSLSLS